MNALNFPLFSAGMGSTLFSKREIPSTGLCVSECVYTQRGRVCVGCSVLQCAAVCCSVLQCVAVRCSVLQYVTVCCSVMQCVAV